MFRPSLLRLGLLTDSVGRNYWTLVHTWHAGTQSFVSSWVYRAALTLLLLAWLQYKKKDQPPFNATNSGAQAVSCSAVLILSTP